MELGDLILESCNHVVEFPVRPASRACEVHRPTMENKTKFLGNVAVMKYEKHDDVIKWKHFPRYWPFVRGIHRSPVNSPYKGH